MFGYDSHCRNDEKRIVDRCPYALRKSRIGAAAIYIMNASRVGQKKCIKLDPVKLRSVILDAEAITMIDITATYALEEIRAELKSQGIDFAIARARTALRVALDRYRVFGATSECFYPSIHSAVRALLPGSVGQLPGPATLEKMKPSVIS